MKSDELQIILQQIRDGDELARERMIRHYKPYIINVAGKVSKKFVSWNDEESSIALLAFNKALDHFEEEAGRTFLNYVYLLIHRDLIDYYRKENKETHFSYQSTSEDEKSIDHESDLAIAQYEKEIQAHELIEEILELDLTLQQYKIAFEELEKHSPKHRDTREDLFDIAHTIAEDDECTDLLISKKKLPSSLIVKKYGWKKKTLERHRKYLITLIVIALNPQWEQLSQYVRKKGTE
ncbi:RNA polymerase sigma-I factor [Halalkalibacter krulwichiae]|uniref:RNA polymerase sigma factor SigI n=1 Tax=Halalkalibacter krulwichiae TaxID=199441 RepID=A0A1X9MAE8_9BACI|nr:RNA polymerase sigma-I factor [Halalkalibacter krulwichiae]ARK29570.1 RNA polymerase sigma factor SigI [Halalkalibacter krulwichiae]